MKNKIALIGLFAMAISGCVSEKYLPSVNNIDINQYGSYIQIFHSRTNYISGELIAVDSNNIVMLARPDYNCVKVSINDVGKFKLYYAKPKNYGWSIPVLALLTPFIHGSLAGLTMPIGLVVTISATVSGDKAFTYTNKNISYENLKRFARFPQGIPPGVDLPSLE